jgi:hypothetical protein
MSLVIDILAPRTAYFPPGRLRQGLGGNEATLVLWWRALRARGVRTRVYLDGQVSGRAVADWDILRRYAAAPGPAADVVIGWRDAAPLASAPPRALTMLYTGDRVTPHLDALAHGCDMVFVGSPAAFDRYSRQLRPRRGWLVDSCGHALPDIGQVSRRRWRCVHASAPYRGLAPLLQMWPQIRRSLPEAELLVLGGYQLWGYRRQEARDMTLREAPALADPPPGVRYLGPLPREHGRVFPRAGLGPGRGRDPGIGAWAGAVRGRVFRGGVFRGVGRCPGPAERDRSLGAGVQGTGDRAGHHACREDRRGSARPSARQGRGRGRRRAYRRAPDFHRVPGLH